MLLYLLFLLIIPKIILGTANTAASPPIVTIPDGKIAGTLQESDENKLFHAYFQIPYAQPPVEALRFKEPLPPSKWNGILNNTKDTKICYQFSKTDPRETEDCLYLNVYTTIAPENNITKLPVLVWIHGGSFMQGSGAFDLYGPHFFIDYDIVIVSINYRLGPLGFLSTDDGVIAGNIGLKDQVLALKWVKSNIEYFGGNPEEVTIMGQSAGAAAVGYLVMSDKTKGLYRAAIMDSGTPLMCWSLQKFPKSIAYQLGSMISSSFTSKNSSEDLLKLLQEVPASKLKEYYVFLPPAYQRNCYDSFFLMWAPSEESEEHGDALVKGAAHERLKNGECNRVPLLLGFNSQELLLFDVDGFNQAAVGLDLNTTKILNTNLNMPSQNRSIAGRKIREIYTNGNFSESLADSIRFGSDSLFTTPIARHASLYSQYTDVYLYQFSYKGKLGEIIVNKTIKGAEGVGHQEELEYLFKDKYNGNNSDYPASDITTRKRLLELWTSFIKTMNPTPKEITLLENVTWPKVKQNNISYLDIDTNITIKSGPKHYGEWSSIINDYTSDKLDTY